MKTLAKAFEWELTGATEGLLVTGVKKWKKKEEKK